MAESEDEESMNITEDEEQQNYSLKKQEREIEIADVLSKIENGTLEIYRSSGISPAWKHFMKIRDATSKQRIHYVQCVECKALLTYKEHGGTSHLNRHKCKINDPTAECVPFRRVPDEKVDDVQKILVKNIIKFCAENLSSHQAVCGSVSFINFLQSFVTMGQNLGNIELKKIFPKSNTVQRKIESLKDENRRTIRVICTACFNQGDSPDLFLTKLMNVFNNFGGHEQDLIPLVVVTDKQPIFIESLKKFDRRLNCIADIIIDILNETFQASPNQETNDLITTCKTIVGILMKSEKHNFELIRDDGTWVNKLLMVQSVTDQYNDIAVVLEMESRVNFEFNKRRAQEFISFLEPFVDALRDLSSNSYPTANKVLLWWTFIRDHLGTFQNYSYELKHMMINAMDLFRSKFVLTIDNKIDCFLDPRYKLLKMLSDTERTDVIAEVKKRLDVIIVDEIVHNPAASTSKAPSVKKSRFADYETKKGDSRKILPKKVSKKSKEETKNENRFKRFETNDDENLNDSDEVVRYLKMPPMKSSEFGSEFDVISKFWKSQQKHIPKLYKLAISRLHIPMTCGCGGQTNPYRQQHSLSEGTLHDLLFIKDKLKDPTDKN
ncbi:hypothetical protein HA402_004305 [Bradysia odoriphaga]|nr:hypothetical protein HA402_004305 [Bradysia odoriphaga]